jgi:hypothetical protein
MSRNFLSRFDLEIWRLAHAEYIVVYALIKTIQQTNHVFSTYTRCSAQNYSSVSFSVTTKPGMSNCL